MENIKSGRDNDNNDLLWFTFKLCYELKVSINSIENGNSVTNPFNSI